MNTSVWAFGRLVRVKAFGAGLHHLRRVALIFGGCFWSALKRPNGMNTSVWAFGRLVLVKAFGAELHHLRQVALFFDGCFWSALKRPNAMNTRFGRLGA